MSASKPLESEDGERVDGEFHFAVRRADSIFWSVYRKSDRKCVDGRDSVLTGSIERHDAQARHFTALAHQALHDQYREVVEAAKSEISFLRSLRVGPDDHHWCHEDDRTAGTCPCGALQRNSKINRQITKLTAALAALGEDS